MPHRPSRFRPSLQLGAIGRGNRGAEFGRRAAPAVPFRQTDDRFSEGVAVDQVRLLSSRLLKIVWQRLPARQFRTRGIERRENLPERRQPRKLLGLDVRESRQTFAALA